MRLLDASYKDGMIYCSFERDAVTSVQNTDFDLGNQKLHLFLVTGASLKPTGVGYHDIVKRASEQPQLVAHIEEAHAPTKVGISWRWRKTSYLKIRLFDPFTETNSRFG
jgi:hypothetical protein